MLPIEPKETLFFSLSLSFSISLLLSQLHRGKFLHETRVKPSVHQTEKKGVLSTKPAGMRVKFTTLRHEEILNLNSSRPELQSLPFTYIESNCLFFLPFFTYIFHNFRFNSVITL